MEKSCNNCYWKLYAGRHCLSQIVRPKENLCSKHRFECNTCGNEGEYKYEDEYYCWDCLLTQFDIEEYTETHYMINGEYIGSDEDIEEVIFNLGDNIVIID